jgi:hypothetical protein
MVYSGLCEDCPSLGAMWLVTATFTAGAVAAILWRRPNVIFAALAWIALAQYQLGPLTASTPRPWIHQAVAATVITFLVPLVTWLLLEWRHPATGLYRAVVPSGFRGRLGARLAVGGLIGFLLAAGPSYVLRGLGVSGWPVIILFSGVILTGAYGEALRRKAAA